MLKPTAFANSVGLLTAIFFVVFYLLKLFVPKAFEYLFNAQFLGANAASLVPGEITFGSFLGIFVTMVVMAWVMGFLWAWFYNRFAK